MSENMKWTWCKDCVYVDDCSYAANSDGCYSGEREGEAFEEEEEWFKNE